MVCCDVILIGFILGLVLDEEVELVGDVFLLLVIGIFNVEFDDELLEWWCGGDDDEEELVML